MTGAIKRLQKQSSDFSVTLVVLLVRYAEHDKALTNKNYPKGLLHFLNFNRYSLIFSALKKKLGEKQVQDSE